ncbi:uncharacterized protein LOC144039342 isoform X1 [Vanacampus margaritifer]
MSMLFLEPHFFFPSPNTIVPFSRSNMRFVLCVGKSRAGKMLQVKCQGGISAHAERANCSPARPRGVGDPSPPPPLASPPPRLASIAHPEALRRSIKRAASEREEKRREEKRREKRRASACELTAAESDRRRSATGTQKKVRKIAKKRQPSDQKKACLDICKLSSQTERPHVHGSQEKQTLAGLPKGNASAVNGARWRSYLMEHFRWSRPYRNKTQESRAGAHNPKRGYAMEHFRWGKPTGNMTPGTKPARQGSKRSPYAMEHFRWGKPAGRKHKAVKIFALPSDNAGSPEAVGRPRAGRRRNGKDDGNLMPARPQGRKTRPQRGSPPNGDVGKNPQGLLADIFRDILLNDVHRIVG